MTFLRNLDLGVLTLALPVFLATGLPVLGWVTAAAIWAMWRGVGVLTERRAAASDDPRATAGLLAGSMIGRGWAMGLILVAVGLTAGEDVGLSAAVLSVVLFTIWFTLKMLLRPFGGPPTTSTT